MTMRNKLRLVWMGGLTAAVACCQVLAATVPDQGIWLARVTYVVDGDSLWVRSEASQTRVKLRLEGIDAPEICQTDGGKARDALRALAQGQRVRVTVHAHDRWGRAIANVQRVSDGQDLAEQMAKRGWAWADRWARYGTFSEAEAQARQGARGVFGRGEPEYPADFRRRHGPCH